MKVFVAIPTTGLAWNKFMAPQARTYLEERAYEKNAEVPSTSFGHLRGM